MEHQESIHLSGGTRSSRELAGLDPVPGKDAFTRQAILTLMGSFCVHLVVGSQYAWGAMSIYIVGYFRYLGNLDANMSQFYLVLPLIVIMSTVIFPIGMDLAERLGSRITVAIGGTIVVTTTLLASFTRTPV